MDNAEGITLLRPSELQGFIAELAGAVQELVNFELRNNECEVVTLDSLLEREGVGSALMRAVCQEASSAGCARLWLITTNDNLDALRFYQRRGLILARLHKEAIAESGNLKPLIPLVGNNGIPIRDELELEMIL